MAKESDLTLKEFWQEIINACYLESDDPIVTWKSTFTQINDLKKKLNELPIEKYHMISDKTDLYITLGEKRRWQGGSGANIPSFEIFTSPDWRGVNGKIFFNFPLYDENFGGQFGNSHLAVGTSYHDCYNGDIKSMTEKDWERLGFNESVEHCDIINTNDKTVA